MAGIAGFEPTSDGVKVRCLTAWRYPNINGAPLEIRPPGTWLRRPLLYPTELKAQNLMERVKGIEPSLKAWEASVLPLNYTRVNMPTRSPSLRAGVTPYIHVLRPAGQPRFSPLFQIGVLPICRTLIKNLGSFRSAIELHPQ